MESLVSLISPFSTFLESGMPAWDLEACELFSA
jgi:hypothetical protein